MPQTKSGRNIRWYIGSSAVGFGRVLHLKPDTTIKQEAVKECGNGDVIEFVPGVRETAIVISHNVFNKKQFAVAAGQTIGQLGTGTGHVPELSDFVYDIVERRIKPGTEGTLNEVVDGYTLYQLVSIEKHAYDQEVDKLLSRTINGKGRTPLDFEGINGIAFDSFTGNGVQTAFVLAHRSVGLSTGYVMCRVEAPLGTILKEGVDYTVASTSSTTTVNFGVAPASSAVPNGVGVYAW